MSYKRNLVELGAGGFVGTNRANTITFNLYGGVGFGKFSFDDNRYLAGTSSGTKYHSSNITK